MSTEATAEGATATPLRPRFWQWPLALAVPLLATALAYPWGVSLITAMLLGRPDRGASRLLIMVCVGLVATSAVVTFSKRLQRYRNAIAAFAVTGFLAVSAAIVVLRVANTPAKLVGLPLYAVGSTASVWLATILVWRFAWWKRLAVLIVLAATLAAFWQVIRIEGLSGDAEVVFGFRATTPPAALSTTVAANAAQATTLEPGPNDFAQYLGPSRDGRLPKATFDDNWSASPPNELWRHRVGEGWGGFAVVGSLAFTQEQRGEFETVVCYDLATGEERWIHTDPLRFDSSFGGPGPRATPTVVDGRIYTLGGTGRLNCFTGDGSCLWTVDTLPNAAAMTVAPADASEQGGEPPDQGELLAHGVTGSPLVIGNRVYVSPCGRDGRSLAAYDTQTGSEVFRTGTKRASYASPMLATLAGVEQILVFQEKGITGHSVASGEELWSFTWGNDQRNNCGQPLVLDGDRLLLSTGYGTGSVLLQLAQDDAGALTATEVWRSRDLKSKFATPVLHDGFVYGLDDGILVCLDPETGKRRWKRGRYGHGQLLLAGGLLLVQTEAGPVVLVTPSPDGLKEVATLDALADKTWNTIALSGDKLLVRNSVEAACYQLSKQTPAAAAASAEEDAPATNSP